MYALRPTTPLIALALAQLVVGCSLFTKGADDPDTGSADTELADTAAADADADATDGGDDGDVEVSFACGDDPELTFDGAPAQPGDSCGCNEGVLTCTDDGTLACTDDEGLNACGGCAALDDQPGAACGSCATYVCDATTLVCDASDCDVCDDPDELDDATYALGDPCGTCDEGEVVTCLGDAVLVCLDAPGDERLNACGGCASLPEEVVIDGACDVGRAWSCVDDDNAACTPVLCDEDQRVVANACVDCVPGSRRPAGDDATGEDTDCAPELCEANYYVVANRCVACAPGTTNEAGDNATSETDGVCDTVYCEEDHYVAGHACTPCVPGASRPPGDDASGDDTHCASVICGEDERVSLHACVACDPGTVRPAGDEATGEDTACAPVICGEDQHVINNACVPCDPGAVREAGDDASQGATACETTHCEADHYVLDHVCTPCAPGSTHPADTPATGADTSCETTLCGLDHYVLDHVCTPCAPGSTHAEGTPATGDTTACDVTLCGVDERVVDHVCVPCALGEQHPAGDEATGDDTTCEVISCGVDERVQDHACVVCELGATNAAGDPATEADTACDPTFCGVGERVSDHVCVPCEPDTYRHPGDNATLGDSFCEPDACYGTLGVFCDAFEEAYLKASNTGGEADNPTSGGSLYGDHFGYSVAIDGDTLVVGAVREASLATGVDGDGSLNDAQGVGAVYVFVRDGRRWTQEAYLKASNSHAGMQFGNAVSLDGDRLAVAAHYESGSGAGVNPPQSLGNSASGAVYLFERTDRVWAQTTYFKASTPGMNDYFGRAIDLEGDTLVVGATWESSAATTISSDGTGEADDSAPRAGAVYVFREGADGWGQEAYIKGSHLGTDDHFGYTLDMDGDTLAVGAFRDDSGATGVVTDGDPGVDDGVHNNSGAVYVFTRDGVTWSQEAYIKPSDTDVNDEFGRALALDSDTLVVGARARNNGGGVYVFERGALGWAEVAVFSTGVGGDELGWSVAVDGDLIAAGAHRQSSGATGLDGNEDDRSAVASGAVYLYRRGDAGWTPHAFIKASTTGDGDELGWSVDLDGDTLIAGAPYEDSDAIGVNGIQWDDDAVGSGAVYVRRVRPCEGEACSLRGLRYVPAGAFTMGSPTEEIGRNLTTEAEHDVTITRAFYLGSTEVTVAEWEARMGTARDGVSACDGTCAAWDVNWYDALAFANARSRAEGLAACYDLTDCAGTPGTDYTCTSVGVTARSGSVYDCEGYRLPTEAEWEYAARAGTTTAYYGGPVTLPLNSSCDPEPALEATAWYCGTATRPAPVGRWAANPWGLFDMSGNLWEWCWDDFVEDLVDATDPATYEAGTRAAMRGGSYYERTPTELRSATRSPGNRGTRQNNIGFRLARTAP